MRAEQVVISTEEGVAHDLYIELLLEFENDQKACPTVIVCREITVEGRSLDAVKTDNGIIMIREGVSYRDVKDQLRRQNFTAGIANFFPTSDAYWEYFEIFDVCADLRIKCPQLIVTKDQGLLQGSRGCILPSNGGYPYVFVKADTDLGFIIDLLPHELRHIWQHKYHEKKYFSDYKYFKDLTDHEEMLAYYLQPAEVDAEAFSVRRNIYRKTETFPVRRHEKYPEADIAIEERARQMILPTKYSY